MCGPPIKLPDFDMPYSQKQTYSDDDVIDSDFFEVNDEQMIEHKRAIADSMWRKFVKSLWYDAVKMGIYIILLYAYFCYMVG